MIKLWYEVINEIKGYFKDKVYKTIIPRNIRLSEAPSHGKPIPLYDSNSIGAVRYEELAKEFLGETVVSPKTLEENKLEDVDKNQEQSSSNETESLA